MARLLYSLLEKHYLCMNEPTIDPIRKKHIYGN